MSAEERIHKLNILLPPAPKPMAVYSTAVRTGNLLFVSGHGPYQADGSLIKGRLGENMDIAEGQNAARVTGLAILATLRTHLGSLDKIVRPVKVLGMVNSTSDFVDHPAVINGFSNLMVEVFGDEGKSARSAVGMPSLPGGIAVEIEAIFEIRD